MAIAKFIKGTSSQYLAGKETYSKDGSIFVATDSPIIYVWGQEIIGVTAESIKSILESAENLGGVKSVTLNETTNELVITPFKGSATNIKLKTATTSLDGLMSKEQVNALETATSEIASVKKNLAVESVDKTIKVTAGSGENKTNIEVNIDGETLVKDSSTGKISVASKALTVTGKEAIAVADNTTGKEVSLKISSSDKVLSQDTNGLLSTLNLKYVSATDNKTGTNANKAVLQILGVEDAVVSEIDATQFVKDGMLSTAALKKGSELGDSYTADNTYLVLGFNTDGGTTPVILDVTQLVDVYLAGNGLQLTGKTFSVKLVENEKYLSVTSDGLASKGIDTAISTAVETEKNRAEGVEEDLDERIEALEGLVGDDSVEDQISDALDALDLDTVGGTGKVITSVTQTDGQIAATAIDLTATNVAATKIGIGTATNVQGILTELYNMWEWHEA